MKREILLAREGGGSRGAVLVDGTLTDYRAGHHARPSLVGGVFRARVRKAMPGLAAAVVEFAGGEAWLDLARGTGSASEGATLAVQIVQDAPAGKLPRASLHPMIAGRFLALQPGAAKSSLSHRIADNGARARLGALLARLGKGAPGAFVALQRAAAADDEALQREAESLAGRWRAAEARLAGGESGAALPPAEPTLDLLRLFVGPETVRVAVDGETLAATVRAWLADHAPEWRGAIEREPMARTTLESAAVRDQLEAALDGEVPLPGGGALLVVPAAGMTVVDVDTERASGLSAQANFARVNREAARAVAQQIRLRNLGGRIVVDFAGLGAVRDLPAVLGVLRGGVADDPMAVQIGAPSEFGLVEIIRRRERATLAEMLAPP